MEVLHLNRESAMEWSRNESVTSGRRCCRGRCGHGFCGCYCRGRCSHRLCSFGGLQKVKTINKKTDGEKKKVHVLYLCSFKSFGFLFSNSSLNQSIIFLLLNLILILLSFSISSCKFTFQRRPLFPNQKEHWNQKKLVAPRGEEM